MKKQLIGIFILLILAACAATESPDVEPALTAVLESKPTAAASPVPTDTAVPAPTASPAPSEQSLDTELESTDSTRTETEIEPAGSVAADVLVVLDRSGGFAGLEQQWTIYADGRIDMPDGSQTQVSTEQIETLLTAIEAANVLTLSDSYVPADACCDQFYYNITVYLESGTKQIATMDDAPKQPETVTAVLDAINDLIAAAK